MPRGKQRHSPLNIAMDCNLDLTMPVQVIEELE
jgi:hypothetical protein